MATLGIRVPIDLHIVGRVHERRVDRCAGSDDPLEELDIAAIAAADAMIA